MKLLQDKEYSVITVDNDGRGLQHRGNNGNSAEYAPMHLQMFKG